MFFNKENDSFIDLTPVDNADPGGCYTNALSFALKNSRIRNIALTGPHGSGKSSILKTYEKNSDHKFLNISLASFEVDKDKAVNTTLIERSILQQMLYGIDANKLPYSRFKRILTPEKPLLKSLFLVLWVIFATFFYKFQSVILDLESNTGEWWIWIFLLIFLVSLPVLLVSEIYKASFGLSLKKFSLKNVEIEAGEPSEDSILNRHLDEIIYFFQETDYNVVVIEDLDRFGNPEIFVKLREINKIINDNNNNDDSNKPIKFLYALKDDMFADKIRAKFFDFIIPVVPIINSSNSLDKMQERLKEYDFSESIDTQFLREVSLYIDDLRLIHNIFNEFVIYYQRLGSESLDVTKLLAMMIYKNVYPNDFENLHYGKGALFEICIKKAQFLRESKDKLNDKIEKLRSSIESANNEKARSIRELIDTYVGHIVMHADEPVFGIVRSNQHVGFSQLTTFEQFEPVISVENIQIAAHAQNHPNHRIPINKSFSQIEEEINPGETFLSRKENIENVTDSKKIELVHKIKSIEEEVTGLPQLQLHKLLQSDDIGIDELVSGYKFTDRGLLVFLVKNGYLDDNYHLYISTFHEGRLTKNDRDFLLTIRNFNQPEPNQKIDTPNEVCETMREEDFSHKYVLNVAIVDYLLDNDAMFSSRIKSAMRFISQHYEQSEGFLAAYYIAGKHIVQFIRYLSKEWPGFSSAVISSKNSAEQVSYILRFVDAEYVSKNMNAENLLADYLSKEGHLVLTSDFQLPDDYNVLKWLGVRFHDLVSLEKNYELLEFVHEESLYAITSKNINYILQTFSNTQSIDAIRTETANYTSILAEGSENLREYIEKNLSDYIQKVFLSLPKNTEESESAIKALLNHEIIEDDLREKIISKQDYVFGSFDGIPGNLWPHLLLEEKVATSWKNISEYLSCENSDESVLTELLGRQPIVESLSSSNISIKYIGEDKSETLSRFIFCNDEIDNSYYCKLIKCLPYNYSNFPTGISYEKINCLVNERKVRLTEKSFSFIDDDQIVALLISKNFNEYFKGKEEYPISDDVRELLLSGELNNENKIIISLDVTPAGAINNKKLSNLMATLLLSNAVDYENYDDGVLSSAIFNASSRANSIQLLTRCISAWDEAMTMKVISGLPEPFSEIASYGKRPKINNNKVNFEFAKLLESKSFVSTVKEEGSLIKVNTYLSSDHTE